MATQSCLIQQSNCGLKARDLVCNKCGLDTQVRYVSEDAANLAQLQAQTKYWQSEAKGLQTKIKKQDSLLAKTVVSQSVAKPRSPPAKTTLNPQAAWPFPTAKKP